MNLIKVTNKNTFEIVEYYEGMCYKFTPDEAVNVPVDAMKHIFGVDFPEDETVLKSMDFRNRVFEGVRRRWGWNSHKQEENQRFRNLLNLIAFAPVAIKTVEVAVDNTGISEPRTQKHVPKTAKPGKYAPAEASDDEATAEDVA